jgi:hypothetical protein
VHPATWPTSFIARGPFSFLGDTRSLSATHAVVSGFDRGHATDEAAQAAGGRRDGSGRWEGVASAGGRSLCAARSATTPRAAVCPCSSGGFGVAVPRCRQGRAVDRLIRLGLCTRAQVCSLGAEWVLTGAGALPRVRARPTEPDPSHRCSRWTPRRFDRRVPLRASFRGRTSSRPWRPSSAPRTHRRIRPEWGRCASG